MGWVCCIDSHHFSRSARLKYQRFLPFLSPPGICPSRAHRRNDDAGIPVSSESWGIVTALLRSSAEKSGLVFISHTSYTMKILCVLKANQNECKASEWRKQLAREKFLKLFLTDFNGYFQPLFNAMLWESETFLYRVIFKSQSFLDEIRIGSPVIAVPNGRGGR